MSVQKPTTFNSLGTAGPNLTAEFHTISVGTGLLKNALFSSAFREKVTGIITLTISLRSALYLFTQQVKLDRRQQD